MVSKAFDKSKNTAKVLFVDALSLIIERVVLARLTEHIYV